jgi:uncharacterized SAM-binding protein YcdF (DUF218 family)
MDALFYTKKLLTGLALPPVSLLLLIVLGLSLLRWRPRWGQVCAWTGVLLLTVCCLPATSQVLVRLVRLPAGVDSEAAARAQAVVVLGGGRQRALEYGGETVGSLTLERVRYGAMLAKQRQLPLLVSGGLDSLGAQEAELMDRALRDSFGMQARWVEPRSRDTHENAQYSAQILRQAGIHTVLLVTHDIHQRRSIAEFSGAGIEAVSAPVTSVAAAATRGTIVDQLPSTKSFHTNVMMLHEILGNAARWVLRHPDPGGTAGAVPHEADLPIQDRKRG